MCYLCVVEGENVHVSDVRDSINDLPNQLDQALDEVWSKAYDEGYNVGFEVGKTEGYSEGAKGALGLSELVVGFDPATGVSQEFAVDGDEVGVTLVDQNEEDLTVSLTDIIEVARQADNAIIKGVTSLEDDIAEVFGELEDWAGVVSDALLLSGKRLEYLEEQLGVKYIGPQQEESEEGTCSDPFCWCQTPTESFEEPEYAIPF